MEKKEKNAKDVSRSESMPASPRRNIPSRSMTLPANSRLSPVVGGAAASGGFFTRLKRCLKIGSKGRYNFTSAHAKNPRVTNPLLASVQNIEQSPSQTLRQLRRNIPDKEEVVLLHKGPRIVDNNRGDNSRILESVSEDTIVQFVGASQNTACQSSRLDDVVDVEQNRIDDLVSDDLDEMDPGYETLDEVRKKVQMQLQAGRQDSETSDLKVIPEEKVEIRKHLAEPIPGNENGERFPRDSGLATPLTDSPDSYRESNAESVNSSVFSESTGIADESGIEVDMLDLDNINVFDHLSRNSAYNILPCLAENHQRHNSDSFLTQPCFEIEEELYANPKVISRKQSQKQKGSETEISADESHLTSARLEDENVDVPVLEKSVSEGDVSNKPWRGSSVESDKSAPPLPERKYTLSDNEISLVECCEPETSNINVGESNTSVKIDSKIDIETSEESTLDAVSDSDVVTDNELETVCEITAVESLDDGYQTIKDVETRSSDLQPNLQAQNVDSNPSTPAEQIGLHPDPQTPKLYSDPSFQARKGCSDPNKEDHKNEAGSYLQTDEVDSSENQQAKEMGSNPGEVDTVKSTVKKEMVHCQEISSSPNPRIIDDTDKCSTQLVKANNLHPSVSDTVKHIVDKMPTALKKNVPKDNSVLVGSNKSANIMPVSVTTSPLLVCSDQFQLSPDHFEMGCKSVAPTSDLADSYVTKESKSTNQDQTIPSESKTTSDEMPDPNRDQNENASASADVVNSLRVKPGADSQNLVDPSSTADDSELFNVTLRDKTHTGQHNVVVIKLHESAHEDLDDTDFSDLDLEPIHCSFRDLIRQMEQQTPPGQSVNDDSNLCEAGAKNSAMIVSTAGSENVGGNELTDRTESEDVLFRDDEPIHMSLDELLHTPLRNPNESNSVISSLVAQQNTDILSSYAVSSPRISDQSKPSSERKSFV